MSAGLRGRLALDTSALIELVFSSKTGLRLREAMKDLSVDSFTTELHITELRYVLCRRIGLEKAGERVGKLLTSGYISVVETSSLIVEATKIKCERAISLADCFCLALANVNLCVAVFAKREAELVAEMQKKPIDMRILFLDDLS